MWIDDQVVASCCEPLVVKSFFPKKTFVVLGRSNQKEREVNIESAESDGIEVYRRYGGGGAVVLHSGCFVISVGVWVKDYFRNDFYFHRLNHAVGKLLEIIIGKSISYGQKGISDLCIGDKKFGGTSLFRSRHYLLYQASILLDKKADLMERYLRHPSKEPDYRQGRNHREFLMGLRELYPVDDQIVDQRSQKNAFAVFNKELKGDLISPVEKETIYLLRKTASSGGCR